MKTRPFDKLLKKVKEDVPPVGAMSAGPLMQQFNDDPEHSIYFAFNPSTKKRRRFSSRTELDDFLKLNEGWSEWKG